MTKWREQPRQMYRTGKSVPSYGNHVNLKISRNQKYFAFPEGRNSGISIAIPARYEGRFAIVISAGRGAVDAEVPLRRTAPTRTAKTCGPDASVLASSS